MPGLKIVRHLGSREMCIKNGKTWKSAGSPEAGNGTNDVGLPLIVVAHIIPPHFTGKPPLNMCVCVFLLLFVVFFWCSKLISRCSK